MKKTSPVAAHNELSVQQVLRVLRRRWMIIALAAMVGGASGFAFQTYYPKKYKSETQLLVMRKDPRLASNIKDSGSEQELRVTEELLATHMQMLQSRSVVERALSDAGLVDLPSIRTRVHGQEKPCDAVIADLKITRGGSGQARTAHVLNVAYRSSSEEDSRTVLRAIIDRYQKFLAEKFQDVNQEAASLIERAQTELAEALEQAEKDYEQFRQESTNLMWKRVGEDTTNVHRVRYESILQDMTSLQLRRAEGSARLDAMKQSLNGKSTSELSELERLSFIDEKNLTRVGMLLMVQKSESESPNFLAEQPIRLAHAKAEVDNLAEMQMKEQALLTDLGDGHPDVVSVRKQIKLLTKVLEFQRGELKSGKSVSKMDSASLFDAYFQLIGNDVLAMERQEERLKVLAEETMELARSMVADEIQGDSLRREVKRKQEIFDAVVDRVREINLAKDYGGFINEVLAEPELGEQVMPKITYALALGALLALIVSALGVGIAEYRDRRFRTVKDLQSILEAPVLGLIPLTRSTYSRRKAASKRRGSPQTPVTHLMDADSRGADAFRILRSSTLFTDGDEFRQVICVTSPNAGEGKTTTTSNLAYSLAQLGRRVLVIDCDLRRPAQHEQFSLLNNEGLTSVIIGGLDPGDYIQPTIYNNLWVMTRGKAVSNPAEFLATGKFSRLVETLRDKFDHIFLDSPPVLPVADVLVTAAIADSVLVVVGVERTTQLQALIACESLRRAGADICGIVANKISSGIMNEDLYGYDSYDYDLYRNQGDSASKVEAVVDTATRRKSPRAVTNYSQSGSSKNTSR